MTRMTGQSRPAHRWRNLGCLALAILSALAALPLHGEEESEVQVTESELALEWPGTGNEVTVRGTHEARIEKMEDFDRGRRWNLFAEVRTCGFLTGALMEECEATGTVTGVGAILRCETEFQGTCKVSYKAKTNAQIVWPLNDPGAPADMKFSDCEKEACILMASIPAPQPNPSTNGHGEGNTPVLIDFTGNGFQLTGLADPVLFDLDADGSRDTLSWTDRRSDDAWLALDRNGNGRIDDGSELFGDATPQPPAARPNGFLALGVYDRPEQGGNGDGWISADDAVFASLLLWRDADHDGSSQSSELAALEASAVSAIDLAFLELGRRDR
jgi:hypothetical protein